MRVWLTRGKIDEPDESDLREEIDIWLRKPKEPKKWRMWKDSEEENFFYLDDDAGHLVEMSAIAFEKIFGYVPEKGFCGLVDLNMEMVK